MNKLTCEILKTYFNRLEKLESMPDLMSSEQFSEVLGADVNTICLKDNSLHPNITIYPYKDFLEDDYEDKYSKYKYLKNIVSQMLNTYNYYENRVKKQDNYSEKISSLYGHFESYCYKDHLKSEEIILYLKLDNGLERITFDNVICTECKQKLDDEFYYFFYKKLDKLTYNG